VSLFSNRTGATEDAEASSSIDRYRTTENKNNNNVRRRKN